MVEHAFEKMMLKLNQNPLPATLLKQYAPDVYTMATQTDRLTPENILLAKIQNVLDDYVQACNPQLC
jgi:tagatose-1,6-bisphosphate aldolase non-catalytic subunit AgaZ/GatZ